MAQTLGSTFSELGEYIAKGSKLLNKVGWHRTCESLRSRCNIHPQVGLLPAASLLDRIRRNGVPVLLASEPWGTKLKNERFLRGPHSSANEHTEFLKEEYLDFCQKGFWMLLPYEAVKALPGLRLSLLGVVPQRERRPRVIVDYSFYDLNLEMVKLSPSESMQFGKANK